VINDWVTLTDAMTKLAEIGDILLLQLLGSSARERGRLQEYCREVWPGWADSSGDAPILEVDAPPEALVPIELLPLFDASPVPDIRDHITLQRVARRFVGFAMAVHRMIPTPISQDAVLHGDPAMHMKMFHHTQLDAASSECEMLRGSTNAVMLTGPWPSEDLDEQRIAEVLAEYLVDPCLGFDGQRREDPDQIHHFSCHCDTGWESPLDYSIELAAHSGITYRVTLRKLSAAMSRLFASARTGTSMPLVVMNACASSATEPEGATSFPELFFVNNQNRGFLGTEARIPDEVAAAFAIRFYRELFQGRPVGQALRAAKLKLLNDFRNPLGALYMYYGNPSLRWEAAGKSGC
jgi:CHAT domain